MKTASLAHSEDVLSYLNRIYAEDQREHAYQAQSLVEFQDWQTRARPARNPFDQAHGRPGELRRRVRAQGAQPPWRRLAGTQNRSCLCEGNCSTPH